MDTNTHTSVGAHIRAVREAAGIPRRQLAIRANMSPGYLKDIEDGHRDPSEKVLTLLCTHLPQLNLDELMAAAGRFGKQAEQYLRNHPLAGVLLRRAAAAQLTDAGLRRLLAHTDQIINDELPPAANNQEETHHEP